MAGWIRIIIGLFLLLISFGIIIGGGALLIIQPLFADADGFINTPTDELVLPDAEALVFFSDDIEIKNEYANTVFNTGDLITLRLIAKNQNQSLEGFRFYYGEATKARAFLANITYYEITDMNMDLGWRNGTMDLTTVKYTPTTTGNTDVPIWWQEESGEELRINKFRSAGFAVILMNPGKEAGIDTAIQIGVNLPILDVIAIALLVFGGLFLLLAIFLIIWGATAKPKAPAAPVTRIRYYTARESAVKEDAGKKILVCATCGTESASDSKFCPECGEPLFSTKEPEFGVRKAEPMVGVTTDMVVADGGARFWAWVIDLVIVSLIVESIKWPFYLFGPTNMFFFGASFSLNSIALFIYWTAMEALYGQSIGKMVLKLEVVTEEGKKPEVPQTIVSAAGKAFFLPFDVILGWITKDEQKIQHFGTDLQQRLSQALSKTVVIRKRYAPPETDKKLTFVSGKY